MVNENLFSQGARKILNYYPKIIDFVLKKPLIPITLEIQLTERCNHHCPNCQSLLTLSRIDVNKKANFGESLDINILNSIWKHPPDGIVLSGNTGEPLLHPQILQIIQIIEEKRIPTVLITNGEALNPTISAKLLKICRGIRISLDAFDSATYSKIHGVHTESWATTIQNIRELINIRKCMNISSYDCSIGIGYLTQDSSSKELKLAIENAIELNLDYIQFRPFHNNYSNITNVIEKLRDYETEKFKIYCSYQKYSNMENYKKDYSQCHGAWFYTVLDARGDIYLCCHNIGNPAAKFCSLKEMTWSDFLSSKERRSIIENFDISKCVQLCRLDTHNSLLQEILDTKNIPPSLKDNLVNRHSPFL